MLVAGNYTFRAGVDARGALKRFMSWNPPAGFAFQSHFAKVDVPHMRVAGHWDSDGTAEHTACGPTETDLVTPTLATVRTPVVVPELGNPAGK